METPTTRVVVYSDSSDEHSDLEGDNRHGADKKTDGEVQKPGQGGCNVTSFDELFSKAGRLGKKLPPVPDSIRTLSRNMTDISQHEDNPDEHKGKKRRFDHVRGNWATYVYIPVAADSEFSRLVTDLQLRLRDQKLEFQAMDDFHLSLSRTVTIYHHWIDGFTDTVRAHVTSCPRFTCHLSTLKCYCNEDESRTFLGLEVVTNQERMLDLMKKVDGCMEDYRLPTFYEDASFHVSVLWGLGDTKEKIALPALQDTVDALFSEHRESLTVNVNRVCAKIGHKVVTFEL